MIIIKALFVSYDNDSHISLFPMGYAYLASACRDAGHDVQIYHQDIYHYPDSHLKDFLNENQFDFVGFGACGGYYQYRKLKSLIDEIHKCDNKPIIAMGGHMPSPDPEFFLNKFKCDVVCIGEGEITIVELLDALENKTSLKCVKGIAYLENGEYIRTTERPLIQDIDSISMPAYDLFPMEHYVLKRFPNIYRSERSFPILSGRGCTFKCNFCYRMDKGFRPRSAESIINEIGYLQDNYNVNYFAFQDELLMSSKERTVEICEKFIDSGLNFHWSCNGRLNYASKEVLSIMKKAGCVFINYGIESVDDKALKNMSKALTVQQIITGVENTLELGISPGLNIIFGNIGEDTKCLEKDVEFLLKYDDHSRLRTIRPVTPYPGSPLYYYAIEKGLIKDCEDFYENKHINSDLLTVNFTELTDEEFYAEMYKANKILLDNHINHLKNNYDEILENLYINIDTNFRGFREV